MTNTLKFKQQNEIAYITFNRPEHMNSLDEVMAKELVTVLDKLRHDTNTRVVVLRGEGKLFMAGGDVSFFYKNLEHMATKVRDVIAHVHHTIQEIQNSEKIFLASVHGSVAGVGVSFMLASDLVIAAEDTKFTLAYSKIGATPDGGATYTLPRVVGTKKAMELALLSEVIDAKTAQSLGMINWVVPSDQLHEQTEQLANRLAKGPQKVFANTKCLINRTWQHTFEEQLIAEQEAFVMSAQSDDFRRGVTAFVNKSKVEFN